VILMLLRLYISIIMYVCIYVYTYIHIYIIRVVLISKCVPNETGAPKGFQIGSNETPQNIFWIDYYLG